MATMRVSVSVPAALVAEVMQGLRALEQRHPAALGMSIWVDAREFSADEMARLIDDVGPTFPFKWIVRAADGQREVVADAPAVAPPPDIAVAAVAWLRRAVGSATDGHLTSQDMMERMEVRDVDGLTTVVQSLSDIRGHIRTLIVEEGMPPEAALGQAIGDVVCTALLLGASLAKERVL